jgi:hypothetical protein
MRKSRVPLAWAMMATCVLGGGFSAQGQESAHTQLEIEVRTQKGDKPVGNASVYVRFPEKPGSDKLTELDLKTNEDGKVRVPPIPRGRIMVQVVAEGKKPFGEWYDVEERQKTIAIYLEPPAHWY